MNFVGSVEENLDKRRRNARRLEDEATWEFDARVYINVPAKVPLEQIPKDDDAYFDTGRVATIDEIKEKKKQRSGECRMVSVCFCSPRKCRSTSAVR